MASEQKLSPLIWFEKPPAGTLPEKTTNALVVGILRPRYQWPYKFEPETIGRYISDAEIANKEDKAAMKNGIVLVSLNDMPVRMPNGYYLKAPRVNSRSNHHKDADVAVWEEFVKLPSETLNTFYRRFKAQYIDAPDRVHVWILPITGTFQYIVGKKRPSAFQLIMANMAPPSRTVILSEYEQSIDHVNDCKVVKDSDGMGRLDMSQLSKSDTVGIQFDGIPVMIGDAGSEDKTNSPLLYEFIRSHQPLIRKRLRAERAKLIAEVTERTFPADIDTMIASFNTGCKYT